HADAAVDARLAVPDPQELVGQIDGRHHRDAIEANHLAAVADLAHAAVEEFGRIEERRALVVRTGDHVLPLHDAYADPRLVLMAHAPCSRVFSRPIMASTRVRTCSFLCMSAARSPASDSCRARSARFSSFRRSRVVISSSMRLVRRVSSRSSCAFVVSLMKTLYSFDLVMVDYNEPYEDASTRLCHIPCNYS